MATVTFALQQPYKKSKSVNKEESKVENNRLSEELKKRKQQGKSIESLLNPDETRIYLFLIINRNNKIKIKTDLKIAAKNWDFKNKKVKSSYSGCVEFNRRLSKLKSGVEEAYHKLINEIPGITFKKLFDNIIQFVANNHLPSLDKNGKSFKEVFKEFIEIKKSERNERTVQKYRTTIYNISKFEEAENYQVEFDTINLLFYDKYKGFLIKNDYLNDTIAKYIETLKYFLKWSYDRNYHRNEAFKHEDFKALRKPKNEIVTLTEEEFNKIINLDLSRNKRLDQVRDLFCFATYTGQRWSDIETFNSKDVNNDEWKFECFKTKKMMKIPLIGFAAPAKYIISKYHNDLPRISSQKFNDYLKEVGQLAGIDNIVVIKRYSGSSLIKIEQPKYAFMSSHMARRTCTTLLLQRGVPVTVVMLLTGHQDIKTLMKYDNTSHEALVSELIRVGQISGPKLKVA